MWTSRTRTYRPTRIGGLLLGVAAVMLLTVSSAGAGAPAPMSTSLAQWMDTAAPDETMQVMVHGSDLAAAEQAVAATGMTRITEFESIDVVVACAIPAQVEAARTEPGVTYLEGDQPLETFSTSGGQGSGGQGSDRQGSDRQSSDRQSSDRQSSDRQDSGAQADPAGCRPAACAEPGSGRG